MGTQREPVVPHGTESTMFERFMRQQPPTFGGGTNPIEAEAWLAALEKVFDVLQYDMMERVRLAVYRLEGEADHWWAELRARRTPEEIGTMDWTELQEVFLRKYFPYTERVKKVT